MKAILLFGLLFLAISAAVLMFSQRNVFRVLYLPFRTQYYSPIKKQDMVWISIKHGCNISEDSQLVKAFYMQMQTGAPTQDFDSYNLRAFVSHGFRRYYIDNMSRILVAKDGRIIAPKNESIENIVSKLYNDCKTH